MHIQRHLLSESTQSELMTAVLHRCLLTNEKVREATALPKLEDIIRCRRLVSIVSAIQQVTANVGEYRRK